ncbi:hypothetical protein AACH06_29330 [Ideonella sp. DXS29W]|uniref:Uncharacterized protein n=1 Tax=Ideonella lacteola TaxID=2984193 RepID=A0ABU9BZR1_9BURK
MPAFDTSSPRAATVAHQAARALGESAWLAQAAPLLVLALLAGRAADDAQSLQLSALLQLTGSALLVLSVVCCKVGVWRAASHRARRGATTSTWLLKLLVLAGGLAFSWAFAARHNGAQTLEMGRIAIGMDPVAAVDLRMGPDGHSLLLRGTLGAGSAERVRDWLHHHAGIRTVRLESAGGRLFEAEGIAADVRRLGLDTHAEGLCASACTMVLLAGRQRTASPAARIGFHRPSFAGVDDDRSVDADVLMRYYRNAGIARAFIDKVRATPSRSMWFPSRQELERHRVLTQPLPT